TVVRAVEAILTIAQDFGARLEDMSPASDGQAIRVLKNSGCGNAIAAARADAAGIPDGQERKARTEAVPSGNTKLLREISDAAGVTRQASGSGAVHACAGLVQNAGREGVVPVEHEALWRVDTRSGGDSADGVRSGVAAAVIGKAPGQIVLGGEHVVDL